MLPIVVAVFAARLAIKKWRARFVKKHLRGASVRLTSDGKRHRAALANSPDYFSVGRTEEQALYDLASRRRDDRRAAGKRTDRVVSL